MAILNIFTKDPMNKKRKAFFESRKWYFYLWEFLVILSTIMVVALLNQLPRWVGESHKIQFADGNGGIDYYISNSLNENIYYSFANLAITIGVAVFIGVYNVMNKFIGKYSSALFVLVPSLVWLLTTTKDNHISNIIEINNEIYNFSFWLVVGLTAFYFLILFIKQTVISFIYGFETRRLVELISNVTYRIIIVFINMAALFILSSALVNFGLFSLHLTDIPLEDQMASIAETGNPIPQYSIPSTKMTTYIAIVTLMFAILVVAVGLSTTFTRKYKQVEIEKTLEGVVDKKQIEAESKAKKMETVVKQKIADELFIADEKLKKHKAVAKKDELMEKVKKQEADKKKLIYKETISKEKEITKEITKAAQEKTQLDKTVEKITKNVGKEKEKLETKVKKLEEAKIEKIAKVREIEKDTVKKIKDDLGIASPEKIKSEKQKVKKEMEKEREKIHKTIEKEQQEIVNKTDQAIIKGAKEIEKIESQDIELGAKIIKAEEEVKKIKFAKKQKVKEVKKDIKEKVKKINKDKKG